MLASLGTAIILVSFQSIVWLTPFKRCQGDDEHESDGERYDAAWQELKDERGECIESPHLQRLVESDLRPCIERCWLRVVVLFVKEKCGGGANQSDRKNSPQRLGVLRVTYQGTRDMHGTRAIVRKTCSGIRARSYDFRRALTLVGYYMHASWG
jgi:hypothetical protein